MGLGLKVAFVPIAIGILSQYVYKIIGIKKTNLYGVGFKSGVRPDRYRDTLPVCL
jgi:hypothetical protein